MDTPAETSQPMNARSSVPAFVKIIAVLYLLAGLIGMFGAIVYLIVGARYGAFSPFGRYGTAGVIAIFIFGLIAWGISRGLRKGQHWARFTAIVLSTLSAAGGLYALRAGGTHGLFQLLVNLAIIAYLIFNRRVREAFKH